MLGNVENGIQYSLFIWLLIVMNLLYYTFVQMYNSIHFEASLYLSEVTRCRSTGEMPTLEAVWQAYALAIVCGQKCFVGLGYKGSSAGLYGNVKTHIRYP